MKKRIRQFLVGLGIVFGLISLLFFGAVSYLKTNHAHRFILGKINGAILGTISCERIRFSLLKGEFELEKMLIRGPSNKELAGFDRLFLDVSWATLLKRDATVTSLILEKPWTTVRVDSQGEINLMRALAASRPEEEPQKARDVARGRGIPINVVIGSLKVVQGSFDYEMVAENLKVVGKEIDITASGNLFKRSGNLTFCIGKGRLDSPTIRTELDRFKLEAMLRQGRIDPLVFEVGTPSSRLTLSGNIVDVFSKPFLDVTLDLAVSLAEVQEGLHLSQALTGQVAAYIAARGTADNPEVSVSLDYGGGMVSAIQIDQIDLNCRMKDRLLTLDRFCVNAGSGDLNLEGTVDLHEAFVNGFLAPQRDLEAISYKMFLKQKEIKLERLFAGANRLEGTVNSDLSVCGKGISPQSLSATLALRVFAEQVRADKVAAPIDCHLKTEASLDKGVARLKELRAEAGDINLRADCDFDLVSEEVAGRLVLDAPNLTGTLSSLGMPDAEGALGLDANLSGSMRQPVLNLALHGNRLGFQDITIGSVLLDANLDQSGMLRIVKLAVQNQKSRLLISGTAQILERERMQPIKDPTFQVTIRGNPIFAEDFVDKVKGKVVLTTNLEGSTRHPKGKVELLGTGLDLGVQKLERLTLLCELDGEKIWVNPLQVVVVPGEMIEGTGWFSLQKSYQIDLISKGISLQNIDKIREQKIAEGKILFDVSGKGTLKDPQIKAEIVLKQPRFEGKAFEDFQIYFDLDDQLARISAKQDFDLNASFHLQNKDFSGSIFFDETDLGPYFKIADRADLRGTVTGKVTATGNADAIDRIKAFVNLAKLNLFFKEKELLHARDLKVSFDNEEISIPALQLIVLEQGQVDIKGRGKRNGPLAFEVDGHIPLQVVSLFVKHLSDISGDVVLSASIGGTQSSPDIRADIGFEKIGFIVPTLSQRLHDLRGRIQITPEAITVYGIQGQLDTGRFDLAGKIDLDGLQPAKVLMTVNAHALPIQVPDTLDMLLDTELKIHGTQEKSIVQGEAVILEGTYYRDINLSLLQVVGPKKREEAPPPSEFAQPFLRNMALDISVKGRNPFIVDNNLAKLDIKPHVGVSGKLNNPIITGRASVESGTVTYQNKTFVVKKGVIDFLNPYKIEPTIDIESEVRVRRWTIVLVISGKPDELAFELTSDPPEEHGDILSLLVFGKTPSELIGGEGGASQSTAQMLATFIAATSGEDIKETTGLDILEVETAGEDEQPSDQVKVTVGKELSKRTTLKYAIESKDGEMAQRAIAEYKFVENVLLSAFQGSRGSFGGVLQFRLEFR